MARDARRTGPALLLAMAVLTGLAAGPVTAGGRARTSAGEGRKIVLIAGKKSHGPGHHEYEKGVRLLKECLEKAPNLPRLRVETHFDGWPADPRTLEDAAAIFLFSDGSDHDVNAHPLLRPERLAQMDRLMRRGVGFVALHYTVFAPVALAGDRFLDWLGGYFDYETGTAPNRWYSKIQTHTLTVRPGAADHPVCRGIAPFPLREEYYYNIRFREPDPRRTPILMAPIPGEPEQEVAWAVQRRDGGRGFAFTGGHYHDNWQVEGFRRLMLNAIVWAAGLDVPEGGVASTLSGDGEGAVDPRAAVRALVVTGHNHPAHDWRAVTAALRESIGRDRRFLFEVWDDPSRLERENLDRFDVLIQNYVNWERPTLALEGRERLLRFVWEGGGLVLVHFANGAWLDWPEYRRLCRRVWVDGTSGHDAYGEFRVSPTALEHPVTRGLSPWNTRDELYFRQQGYLPIEPLITARSNVTGQDEPLAWAFEEGKGRVFQCLLGHAAESIRSEGTAELYRRATAWAARLDPSLRDSPQEPRR